MNGGGERSDDRLSETYKSLKVGENTEVDSKELKKEISEMIGHYLGDKMSLSNIIKRIVDRNENVSSYYRYVTIYLISELNNIDKFNENVRNKYLELLTSFFNECTLPKHCINLLYTFLSNTFESDKNSPMFLFAIDFIKGIKDALNKYCFFSTELLTNQDLYNKDRECYDIVSRQVRDFVLKQRADTINEISININIQRFCGHLNQTHETKRMMSDCFFNKEKRLKCVESGESNTLVACVVLLIIENPSIIDEVFRVIINDEIYTDLLLCSYSYILSSVKEELFGKPEGSVLWRNCAILGKFIGKITIGINKPILKKHFDIKYLLLYGLSRGKLYGIVPIVLNIINEASGIFAFPNPFISGILHLLGSISVIQNIKRDIKVNIEEAFIRYGTSVNNLENFLTLYPDKINDNYDFIQPPFCLLNFLDENQIDKLIYDDENMIFMVINSFFRYPSNFFSQLGDVFVANTVRTKLINGVYIIFKNKLEKITATVYGTVKHLINVDSKFYSMRSVLDASLQLCKNLIAGLLLQTDLKTTLGRLVKKIIPSIDDFSFHFIIYENEYWLKDFMCEMFSFLITNEIKTNSKNVNSDLLSDKYYIKSYLKSTCINAMPLSEHPDIDTDLKLKDKLLEVLNESEFINEKGFKHLYSLPDSSKLLYLIARFPQYIGDDFSSSIRTFFGFFSNRNLSKLTYESLLAVFYIYYAKYDNIYSKNVKKLVDISVVPSDFLIALYRKNAIRSEELSDIFSYILGTYYRDISQYELVLEFLNRYHQEIDLKQFIIPLFSLSNLNNDAYRTFFSIKIQYMNNDVISENTSIPNRYNFSLDRWKSSLQTKNELINETNRCLDSKFLFESLFLNENQDTIQKFIFVLIGLNKYTSNIEKIIDSLNEILILKHYKKVFTIYKFIISITDYSFIHIIADKLHHIRPVSYPYFVMFWIELLGTPRLIYGLSTIQTSWNAFLTLLIDFIEVVCNCMNSMPPTFQVVYKACLRFLLILSHDFPDFISNVSRLVVIHLPFNFIHLRNILLTVPLKNMNVISPLKIDLSIDQIKEIHQIFYPDADALRYLPETVRNILHSRLHSNPETYSFTNDDIITFVSSIESSTEICSHFVASLFEITFSPKHGNIPKVQFSSLPVFLLFKHIIQNIKRSLCIALIQCVADQLKFPSRNTHFFAKLIIEIFSLNLKTDEQYHINELILSVLLKRAEYTPRPWGLQIVILELAYNKSLKLFEFHFTKSERVQNYILSIVSSITSEC